DDARHHRAPETGGVLEQAEAAVALELDLEVRRTVLEPERIDCGAGELLDLALPVLVERHRRREAELDVGRDRRQAAGDRDRVVAAADDKALDADVVAVAL